MRRITRRLILDPDAERQARKAERIRRTLEVLDVIEKLGRAVPPQMSGTSPVILFQPDWDEPERDVVVTAQELRDAATAVADLRALLHADQTSEG